MDQIKKRRLLIYDWDGVLVPTAKICYEINKECNPDMTYAQFQDMSNINYHTAVDQMATAATFKKHHDFETAYNKKLHLLQPEEELVAEIAHLKRDHILTICSLNKKESIQSYLHKHGLYPYFIDILTGDFHSNKTEKINLLLGKYELEPHEAIFITDTVGDIHEAHAANVPTIGVTWGLHDEPRLREAGPNYIVTRPNQIKNCLHY